MNLQTINQKSVCQVNIIARSSYMEITTTLAGPNALSDVILIEAEKLDEFIEKATLIKNQIKNQKNEINRKFSTTSI